MARQSSLAAAAAAGDRRNNNTFRPIKAFAPTPSSFITPTKKAGPYIRAAPQSQCSPRSPVPPHGYSPTSVIGAFDRGTSPVGGHGYHPQNPPQARSSGYHDTPIRTPRTPRTSSTPRHSNTSTVDNGSMMCHVIAENKKYKTEMCKNMTSHGYCRFGVNCHYAHSEEERHSPNVEDLMKDDRLSLPCSIMVSTGFW